MKQLLFIPFFIATITLYGQSNVKLYSEQTETGVNIYADNGEPCPMTLVIEFRLDNLKNRSKTDNYVLEPNTDKQLLTQLAVVKKSKSSRFSNKYTAYYGDYRIEKYDIDYEYYLPYSNDNSYPVIQGYNGKFSHRGQNSLDFGMPEGTEITAIRDGIVVKVVEHNTKSCVTSKDCAKYNNYVTIYHSDNTFAEYAHIKKDGAVVEIGDTVKQGQLIAYSGNVGYSSTPHLHLDIYQRKLSDRITLETRFKTGSGENFEFLKERNTYSRNY